MFARDKRIGPYTYVYLVENVREEGRTKQRIIANLGRKEVVVARGDLDRLARSVVQLDVDRHGVFGQCLLGIEGSSLDALVNDGRHRQPAHFYWLSTRVCARESDLH